MATKKYIELQELSDDDIANELKEIQEQYAKLKFDHAVKGLENPLLIREIRRDVARINAEIRRRELASMSEDDLAKRDKIRSRRRKS